MFEDFITGLQASLQEPLPGRESQEAMAPAIRTRGNKLFDPNDKTRQSSVLILLYPHEGRIYFPLIKRPDYPGVHSGQMALPGGRYEEGDPDLVHTAVRETWEEIGAERSGIKILGKLSELFVYASNNNVLPVVGWQEGPSDWVPDHKEVALVVDADINDLVDPEKRKRKNIVLSSGFEIDSPYFDIQGHVVWGATAMMLSEFSQVVRKLL